MPESFINGYPTKCGSDTCDSNQKLLNDGTCETCPKYEKPRPESKIDGKNPTKCGPDQCGSREKLLESGLC